PAPGPAPPPEAPRWRPRARPPRAGPGGPGGARAGGRPSGGGPASAAFSPPLRDELSRTMVKEGLLPASPERVRVLWLVIGLVVIGLAAFVLMGGARAVVSSPLPLGLGLGVAGLVIAVLSPLMPRKTLRGAQILARVKSFREFLERSSQDELRRLPPDTMHKWLAWAIALG